jgi:hypothetical protein
MRIMVLHIELKKAFAFFASVGLSDCSRYLVGFFVLKLNMNFHLVRRASWILPTYCMFQHL